jgi:hypothetical protein
MTPLTHPQADRPALPWPISELLRVYIVNAVALVALLVTWWVASGTVRNGWQVGALAAAVAAVVVSGCANAIWVLIGRRSVSSRRAELSRSIADVVSMLGQHQLGSREQSAPTARFVTLDGARRYHLADCDLVAGKPTIEWSLEDPKAARREPCGVCRP